MSARHAASHVEVTGTEDAEEAGLTASQPGQNPSLLSDFTVLYILVRFVASPGSLCSTTHISSLLETLA